VSDTADFDRFVRRAGGAPLDYVDGTTPRKKLADGVYTSTEFPARYPISMHNELSYSERWPARLFFACAVASETGGETPLADSRAILRSLDPAVADEFRRRQVRYIRNLHGGRGFGLSWQTAFETQDRERVEEILRGANGTHEWTDQGGLRLSHVRPAVAAHPTTGEAVWFNQAEQFHPSAQAREVYQSMMAIYKGREDLLPQNACFGDGAPFDAEMLDEVRRTYERERVLFPWQVGDLVMIDNVLACHGRMPYTGARKILAAMTS
jgi:alpha-ketoglutarate-dependent taurine dioxygenase